VNGDRDYSLKTKRLVIAQITICKGCCCGNTEHERPEVPVEWLKSEWRKRGLLTSSVDNQRLCGSMRRAERSRDYNIIGYGMARKYC